MRLGRQTETDRPALSRESEEILDCHGKRRIDRKRLREVADRSRVPPVEHDLSVERDQAQNGGDEGALARAIWADDHMQAAAPDTQRCVVDQRLTVSMDRETL